MTKRVQPRHTLRFAVTNVPEGLDMESIIKSVVKEFGGTTVVLPAPPKSIKVVGKKPVRPALVNRLTRSAGTFACRREPTALFAKSVVWPTGAPHKGCGRFFTTEKRRTIHESGAEWNTKVFPNGCLDRILPMSLRDSR